jgi:hypothetical protein
MSDTNGHSPELTGGRGRGAAAPAATSAISGLPGGAPPSTARSNAATVRPDPRVGAMPQLTHPG